MTRLPPGESLVQLISLSSADQRAQPRAGRFFTASARAMVVRAIASNRRPLDARITVPSVRISI